MNYLCRRILLKNTREETGGHVRLESDAGGCAVSAQVSGMPADARLLLLRRDGGARDAGALSGGRLSMLLRGEDASFLVGAAVVSKGRALLFGGEGVDARQARRAAAQTERPRETATHIAAQEAPLPAEENAAETAFPAQSAEESENDPPVPETPALAAELPPEGVLPAQSAAEPENGWQIRETADGERFDATLFENGAPALTLEGFRTAQSPLSPPGMPGAQWIEGFFVEAHEPGE